MPHASEAARALSAHVATRSRTPAAKTLRRAPSARTLYPLVARAQAAYLARSWLSNSMAGVPVSINYEFHDNTANKSDCESNFGSVAATPTGDPTQPYRPKPAYTAALALQTSLGNYDSCARVAAVEVLAPAGLPRSSAFVLRFENASGPPGFAVWTNGTWARGACADPPRTRQDCGHWGISKAQCLSPLNPKGPDCCWNANVSHGGGPQCYKVRLLPPGSLRASFDTDAREAVGGGGGGDGGGGGSGGGGQCFAVTDVLGAPLPGAAARVCTAGGTGPAASRLTVEAPVRRGRGEHVARIPDARALATWLSTSHKYTVYLKGEAREM